MSTVHLAVRVDVEVVPVEAVVAAVLVGGATRPRSGNGGLVFSAAWSRWTRQM